MSTDRYEITDELHSGWVGVRASDGSDAYFHDAAEMSSRLAAGAIRQQSRDLDQLRADLAAAVAERDRLRDEFAVVIGRCWCKRATLHAEFPA